MPHWTKPSVRLRELCQKEVACRMSVVEKSTSAQAQRISAESCIQHTCFAESCNMSKRVFAAWLKGTGESPIKQKAAFVSLQDQPFAFPAQFNFMHHMFWSAHDFLHVMACFGVLQHFLPFISRAVGS